jgi:hypothetical protein
MSELISRRTTDLGVCFIDVYRQPGDLYDSWDIVPWNDGSPHRLPDARYGVDQPEYGELTIDDFKPMHLTEVTEHWDVNGWSHYETYIKDETCRTIANRRH